MGRRGAAVSNHRQAQQRAARAQRILYIPVVGDLAAEKRVQRQIDNVLEKMENAEDNDEYVRLAAVLERLWNLVLPKAGSRRPGRSESRRTPPVAMEAPETPQAPAAGPVNPPA